MPSAVLEHQLTIVDTPGVNDINEQRAEITYGYVPRADAAVFLLDATPDPDRVRAAVPRGAHPALLARAADLRDRQDRSARRGRAGRDGALRARAPGRIVPEPAIFPVSARRELAGKRARSGFGPLLEHIGVTVGNDRRRLLLDHALADAGRLSAFVRQSLAMRRRSLELPLPELEERIARARTRLAAGQKGLDAGAGTIRAETAALKARVRQDLATSRGEFRDALAAEHRQGRRSRHSAVPVVLRAGHVEGLAGGEGESIAAELERLAETILEVASENVREVDRRPCRPSWARRRRRSI